MNILLGFAPFLAFAVLERMVGVEPGLLAGAAVALLLVLRDVAVLRRSPKLLEVGTVLLFGGLAAYGAVAGADWTVAGVRLAVDAGLLAIVLVSLAVGRPFTLQYARERVEPALWDDPSFRRVNTVITAAWGAAFAAMVAVDALWVAVPGTPVEVVVAVTVLALLGAIRFTEWYPKQVRARAGAVAVP